VTNAERIEKRKEIRMQFLVTGYDGKDDKALERRMAAREAHLANFREMHRKGIFLYGFALLNEDGKMAGSMIVCDFPSKGDLEEQWLKHEPYVTGKVWQTIEISRAQVPPFLTDN
jgi:uncharacterized protein YciI